MLKNRTEEPGWLVGGIQPVALVAEGGELYVAYAPSLDNLGNPVSGGGIFRHNLARREHTYIAEFDLDRNLDLTGYPAALQLDATHVYWLSGNAPNEHKIVRSLKDGSGTPHNVFGDLSNASHLAVDTNHLYWATSCGNAGQYVIRAPKPAI